MPWLVIHPLSEVSTRDRIKKFDKPNGTYPTAFAYVIIIVYRSYIYIIQIYINDMYTFYIYIYILNCPSSACNFFFFTATSDLVVPMYLKKSLRKFF